MGLLSRAFETLIALKIRNNIFPWLKQKVGEFDEIFLQKISDLQQSDNRSLNQFSGIDDNEKQLILKNNFIGYKALGFSASVGELGDSCLDTFTKPALKIYQKTKSKNAAGFTVSGIINDERFLKFENIKKILLIN